MKLLNWMALWVVFFDMIEVLKRTLRNGRNERNRSSFKIQLTLIEIKIFNSVILKVFLLFSSYPSTSLMTFIRLKWTRTLDAKWELMFWPSWRQSINRYAAYRMLMPKRSHFLLVRKLRPVTLYRFLGNFQQFWPEFDIGCKLLYNIFSWTNRLSKRYQY